jgi:hypothetical protein
MTRWTGTVWIAVALVPLALTPGSSARTSDVTAPRAAEAGCLVTFKAHNNGKLQVAISRDSQVRRRAAPNPWKKLGLSEWIQPGQTRSWTYNLDLGCKVDRQYRFIVKKFDANRNLLSTINFYWPVLGNGYRWWTRETSMELGDLDRFF